MSSNAYLNALGAMNLSQMCVQGIWDSDSPLKQIPGFTSDVIKRCVDGGVTSIYDVMEMEDDQRNSLLQMDARQMRDVAKVCNAYPSIELAHELEDADALSAGSPITINISLEREVEEDDESTQIVPAPFFPVKKIENWWLVVGEPSTKQYVHLPFHRRVDCR
jgi:pre-mRNA-splicing helicase BRR2